ncbi:PAS domain-containing sensor histidine kinase [Cupriavidus pinatubonensis]|uniref:PAS domain-containing sensor histidine kinase n=1 Tax=Cupriavidus pinatubonensis TaxID=248026 RepID=UPI0036109103
MNRKRSSGDRPRATGVAATDSGESLFHMLLDVDADFAVFLLDAAGVVRTWNNSAERITGYSDNEMIGQRLAALYSKDFRGDHVAGEILKRAESTGRADYEGWHMRKDGSLFWASIAIARQQIEHGVSAGFAAVARDVTERYLYEERLRRSEERLRLMVDAVQEYAIFMIGPNGIVTSWNNGAYRIKGYTKEEILGQHFSVFYTPEDRAAGIPDELLATAITKGKVEAEGWRVRRDGSRFWANVVISAIHESQSGALLGFAKVSRDLTDRKRLQGFERVAELAAASAQATEKEKGRVSRELHDELGQQLAALKIDAVSLNGYVQSHGHESEAVDLTAKLSNRLDAAIAAVRRISANLRPPMLDDLGLVPAIEWLIDDFSTHYSIHVDLHADVGKLNFNSEASTAIFRIVQESLNNVARHSGANEVEVGLVATPSVCTLSVHDDGNGTDLQGMDKGRGLGLRGIRERARMLNATVTFESTKGEGFHLSVNFPRESIESVKS